LPNNLAKRFIELQQLRKKVRELEHPELTDPQALSALGRKEPVAGIDGDSEEPK
jgi:hypothetical protein